MEFLNLGVIDYRKALDLQLQLVEEVASHQRTDTVIFCSHNPIVTIGRATQPQDIVSWTGDTIQVSRGGRATYHGPSQIVMYPILDLNKKRSITPSRDLHRLLRDIEKIAVIALDKIGIEASGQRQDPSFKELGLEGTGVWTDGYKIASLGIAVKRWVSYHGIAINFFEDPLAHYGIRPCGFDSEQMTSVEKELSRQPNQSVITRDEFLEILKVEALRFWQINGD